MSAPLLPAARRLSPDGYTEPMFNADSQIGPIIAGSSPLHWRRHRHRQRADIRPARRPFSGARHPRHRRAEQAESRRQAVGETCPGTHEPTTRNRLMQTAGRRTAARFRIVRPARRGGATRVRHAPCPQCYASGCRWTLPPHGPLAPRRHRGSADHRSDLHNAGRSSRW